MGPEAHFFPNQQWDGNLSFGGDSHKIPFLILTCIILTCFLWESKKKSGGVPISFPGVQVSLLFSCLTADPLFNTLILSPAVKSKNQGERQPWEKEDLQVC
jgi:hypothetical protein